MNDVIRNATEADAAQLAEFGARTFFESFGADNTPEDMRSYLDSAFSPQKQLAELRNPDIETLIVIAPEGSWAGFAQLRAGKRSAGVRSEEHTSELQSRRDLVCRLLLEK